MYLSWLGLSSFKIETKDVTAVTDPYNPSLVAKPLRAKADIVTVSNTENPAHNHIDAIQGTPFVIDFPGEYEVRTVFVQAMDPCGTSDTPSTGMICTFDVEGMRIAHLGDLTTVPPNPVLERMGMVDILLIPVGGGTTLSAQQAVSVINEVEPSLVVPMHYAQKGLKGKEKLAPLSQFLKAMSVSKVSPVERERIRKKDLPGESEGVRVLVFEG